MPKRRCLVVRKAHAPTPDTESDGLLTIWSLKRFYMTEDAAPCAGSEEDHGEGGTAAFVGFFEEARKMEVRSADGSPN